MHTGSIDGIGLQAKMIVQLYGSFGKLEDVPLLQILKPNPTKLCRFFQKNGIDNFEIETKSLGDLKKLQIVHEGGTKPLWYPTHFVVHVGKNDEGMCFLPTTWKNGSISSSNYFMDLYPGEYVMPKSCLYEVIVRTSNLKGAGTTSNVHLMLRGDSEDFVELSMEDLDIHFKRGNVDTFMVCLFL